MHVCDHKGHHVLMSQKQTKPQIYGRSVCGNSLSEILIVCTYEIRYFL